MPIFRASELDRLLTCPGSGWLPRIEDNPGVSAQWGTKVHAWMETGEYPEGKDGKDLERRVKKAAVDRGKLWPDVEFEVPLALNLVTGEARRYTLEVAPPGYTLRAHKAAWKEAFDLEWATGTLDAVGEALGAYWVDDLKTGRNAHWKNYEAQQLFYCLTWSKVKYGEITEGRSTITHWPRYPIGRAPSRHGVRVDQSILVDFEQRLRKLRESILTKQAALYRGDHCRFCPSAPHCPELNRK